MIVVLTGTPGTGKTRIAEEISRRTDLPLIKINEFAKENKLLGKFDGDAREVDIAKLGRLLRAEIKKMKMKNLVLEGHLACEIKIPAKMVIVTRTRPGVLRRRLAARKYAKSKIDENLMVEMLDYCTIKAEKNYKRASIFEVETSGKFGETMKKIWKILAGKGGKFKSGRIGWGRELYASL
ncbi:MAG: AAA family ATPase [Candidatus Micrarchaeota archaeon]|nr:AAA family ATPase [Candidatus Micrarchaeota archaeon]